MHANADMTYGIALDGGAHRPGQMNAACPNKACSSPVSETLTVPLLSSSTFVLLRLP